MEVAFWRRAATAVGSWTPEQRDTVVYASAAAFALGTMRLSSIQIYQQWAEIAIGPYVLATVLSLLTVRRAARRRDEMLRAVPADGSTHTRSGIRGIRLSNVRVGIFLFVLIGSTLLPLTLEVFLQSQTGGTSHVQPEVLVVERSGRLVALGKDPYGIVTGKKLTGQAAIAMRGQPAYDEYDPYGPLMALFGLPSSLHASPKITDARVYFSLVSVMLVAIALALCRGSSEPRLLALQGMTVLPTAALPMATAGDDLPVAAVLLLGMFFLHRRRPLAGGLMLGFAAGLKFTAWPLVLLAFLVARDQEGRRGRGTAWLAAGMAAVLVPSVLPLFIQNPTSFLDNVVRFPLGLGKIGSPAASALPGHILVTMFPQIKHVLPVALCVGAVVIMSWVLVKHRPRTVSDVCRLGGWLMTAGILFAPATRVGYLLYPINFFIWSWLIRCEEDAEVYQEANDVVTNAATAGRSPIAA
ncbi:MAG: glycosyltransferase family 87 protein [Acidimicrobiales bacterium]